MPCTHNCQQGRACDCEPDLDSAFTPVTDGPDAVDHLLMACTIVLTAAIIVLLAA